ncbi:Peptidase family M23 [Pseudarcicella hirudinis]|uniref:Peptidase family M23 n=1 Tax=Pseudarcicella hirudinis TaxID=1079859 RepID=A0A1I5W6S8_9BACT|nr:M23 family metallopeptidase [Pseudarcicella hirudinis]SFQ15353.1 Peptidase family M23 [Pseudarcicella hirudinis]
MKFKLSLLLFGLMPLLASAQKNQLSYPKGYFQFPINPNHRNYLAGGMGDLRTNHFHAGIDIKTQGREGLPVYAAAEGYISKVAVSSGGYGNVIFITHPNGFITVYGHLREFAEPLAAFVKKTRFEKETFDIDLSPESGQFKVSKGQLIAFSGNTGGSAGPHLHFEIRDSKNNVLNPLNFGFTEIEDNIPPVFNQLIVKPMSISSSINGEFARKSYYPIRNSDGVYRLSEHIKASGEIGLELLAVDKMNGTYNSNGLSCAELFIDGKEVFYFHLEQFPHEVQRDFNIFEDYGLEKIQGKRFQKLFIDDGNTIPIYHPSDSKGKLKIEEGKTYEAVIKIFDQFENGSTLKFTITGQKEEKSKITTPNSLPTQINISVDDNTLIIKSKNLKTVNSSAKIMLPKGVVAELPIEYVKNNEAVFLWDLRKGLPESISIDGSERQFIFRKAILPDEKTEFNSPNLNVTFGKNMVFDTLYLETNYAGNTFTIGQSTTPLRGTISASFKTENQPALPDKTSVYRISGYSRSFLGGKWSGNRIEFNTNTLGVFSILSDTIPPVARIVSRSKDYFAFRISDNLSGLKKFKASIGGEYILTDYDYKRALLWSVKKDSTQKFEGELLLELEDNQGNTSIFKTDMNAPPLVIHAKHQAKKEKKKGTKALKGSPKKKVRHKRK